MLVEAAEMCEHLLRKEALPLIAGMLMKSLPPLLMSVQCRFTIAIVN